MIALIIIIFAVAIVNSTDATPSKTRFDVRTFFDKINIENMEKLDYIDRRKQLLKLLYQDDDLQQLAMDEAYELGFMNRSSWIKNAFPCHNYSIPGSGTNINNLTPLDINVMAALGDSLTAGVGIDARNIFGVLWENRGEVFDIGGNADAQTLSNYFKLFNPNIKGCSTKNTFIKNKGDGLNLAVSGSTSADIMDQAVKLITKMKDDPSINMEKDWKMITIFIGNNDICRSCEYKKADQFTVKLFKERLFSVLDKLKSEVPRSFVNIMTMLDVYRVHELNKGIVCSALHLYECPCVAYSSNITKVIEINTEFQTAVSEIADDKRYDGINDFVVVAQPFFENTNIPMIGNEPDLSYFAPDCFHLSKKGHSQVALSLWNSLFEPISTKKRDWFVGETFNCPPLDKPYFATKTNSK